MSTGTGRSAPVENRERLVEIVAEQRRTIAALISAAERKSRPGSDLVALATRQQNAAPQQHADEGTEPLSAAEGLLRTVIDSLVDGLCVLDGEGGILDTNRGWDEMVGPLTPERAATIFDLAEHATLLTPALEEARNAFVRLTAGEAMEFSPAHRLEEEGVTRLFRVRVDAVHGHRNARAVVTLIDVTARREVDETLLAAIERSEALAQELPAEKAGRLEAIGQLAAGIAHEINTPIQFVSDNVRFMADSFERLRELINLMEGVAADTDAAAAAAKLTEIRDKLEEIDVEFLRDEIPRARGESLEGLDRVAQIVRAMRDFPHPGQGRCETDISVPAVDGV